MRLPDLTGCHVRTNQGAGIVIHCKRSGSLLVRLPGDRVRELPRTQVAVVDPPEPEPVPRRSCIHCRGPVTPGTAFPDVCGDCQELLDDLEAADDAPSEPVTQPAQGPEPHSLPWPPRFEPGPDDWSAYHELLAARAFEPAAPTTRNPRSKWGGA